MTPRLNPLMTLLLAVTLASASIAAWNYHRMAMRVAELEHGQRSLEALTDEFVYRSELDRAIREARWDTLQRLEELHREQTPDGAWLRQLIPDRVREAARPDRAVPDPVLD